MPPWTKVIKRYVKFHQSVILFFIYHQESYYLARTSSISASYIIIALAQILTFILPEANCWMKCCVTSNLASILSSSVTCFLFPLHLRILQDFGQSHLQRLNLISFISISFRKKSIYQFEIFKHSIPCKHFHCVICISLQTPKSVTCYTRISNLHTVPLGVTLYNHSVSCDKTPSIISSSFSSYC